jgi:hypothetical protein
LVQTEFIELGDHLEPVARTNLFRDDLCRNASDDRLTELPQRIHDDVFDVWNRAKAFHDVIGELDRSYELLGRRRQNQLVVATTTRRRCGSRPVSS